MSDDSLKELRSATREHLAMVWKMAKLGDEISALAELADQADILAEAMDSDNTETTNLIKALKEHPEYYDVWDHLQEYGDRDIEIDGVSPILHINIHGVIENQLAANDPPFVAKALRKLVNNGIDRHQAIHVVGTALAGQMWIVMSKEQPYDEDKYRQDIDRYVSERLAWEAERNAKKKTKRKKAKRARRRKR